MTHYPRGAVVLLGGHLENDGISPGVHLEDDGGSLGGGVQASPLQKLHPQQGALSSVDLQQGRMLPCKLRP